MIGNISENSEAKLRRGRLNRSTTAIEVKSHLFHLINMYLNRRAALVRNGAVAGINGTVTLIILLIAPLGLAAVIINTILVTIASFVTATAADRVVLFLTPHHSSREIGTINEKENLAIGRQNSRQIDRY